ncbi:MAG: PTS sugar transporter subunit IIC/EAL domain-containing protein [Lachnospiraceae bacterium]|nr:PTS sugar transporter subunit IIC/EAL domain-containing protein [Lachnospiraceae bacterium]
MRTKAKQQILRIRKSFFFIALHNGFVLMIPLILVGATSCAIMNLPFAGYQEAISSGKFKIVYDILNAIYQATYGCFSVALTIALSVGYAMERNEKAEKLALYVIASLSAFGTQLGIGTDNFSQELLGVKGCFAAVFVTMITCFAYDYMSRREYIKMNRYTVGMEPACAKAINSIFPMFTICAAFVVLNAVLYTCFQVTNVQEIVYKVLFILFDYVQAEFVLGLVYTFLLHFLWAMGFHGSHMMEVVASSYFSQVGQDIIFSKSFFDVFVVMGGCGTTVCVLLLGLLFYRKKRMGNIARLSVFTAIFNTNEMLNFGIPIILNPILIVPFLLTPMMAYIISYVVIYLGLVPTVKQEVIWTTPVLFSGYLATGSIRGSILQLSIIVLGMLIYYPFLRTNEKVQEIYIKGQIEKLVEELKKSEEENETPDLLNKTNSYGMVARMLLKDLETALDKNEIFMLYQPQVDSKGICLGAEALVRWKHRDYGFIYPPLIIYLAKEGKILPRLEQRIFHMVSEAIRKTQDNYDGDFKISVNITAKSLTWDIESCMEECIEKYQIPADKMWIEMTEQDMLSNTDAVIEKLDHLKQVGHTLLIDDFGMGHTSLIYLQSNYFDVVKLDGSLVRNILKNPTDQKIVASVVELGEKLGVKVIAEYVETEEQRDKLKELGCFWYQGYLYSKPVQLDEFIVWLKKCNERS